MATEERIARIESTQLGPEDHGIFTAMVHLDYGGSAQGAGGYDLRGGRSCYRFIEGVLQACNVDCWEKVQGCTVLALIEDERVCGLKSLPFARSPHTFRFEDIYVGGES
ncbi:MAG TPA: hypothetical protein VK611_24975 [Acidimicrobiales bacterium]|nr:hypothetical protein [Acidimicrobiales bacterium]